MTSNNELSGGRHKSAGKRRSVTYCHTFLGPQLRPNARMSIAAHQEVGYLLKSVIRAAVERDGVRNKVDSVRSELDEWVMREYDRNELDLETLNKIYYQDCGCPPHSSLGGEEMIQRLEAAQKILARYYPDCPPLKRVLAWADRAIASIHTWNGKPRGKLHRDPAYEREVRLQRRA